MKKSYIYIVWLKRFHSRYGSVREVKSDCELTVRDLVKLFPNYMLHYSIDSLVKLLDTGYQLDQLNGIPDLQFDDINTHMTKCLNKVIEALNKVKCIEFTKYFDLPKGIEIPNKVTDFESIRVTRTPSGLKVIQDSGIRI